MKVRARDCDAVFFYPHAPLVTLLSLKTMKSRITGALFLISIWTVPFFAQAHGTPFFDFNPAIVDAVFVSSIGTPAQVFTPQNDFLSSFDLWLDNRGEPGTANFEVRDLNNQLISTINESIPNIPVNRNGVRFHVDLPSQIPLVGADKYKIVILTAMPDLRIFYGQRLRVLQHNDQYVPEHTNDYALFGNEREQFSFKFTLYETAETVPPVISNLNQFVLSLYNIRLEFNASEPVDFKVSYGPNGQPPTASLPYSGTYELCGFGINTCDATLTVSPDMVYSYTLTAKDSWGNSGEMTGTFSSASSTPSSPEPPPSAPPPTPPPPSDTTPPIISNARVVSVSSSAVQIAWQTNEAADARLSVSTNQNGSPPVAAAQDSTFELEHFLETPSLLSPDTRYYAKISSADFVGNTSLTNLTFKTATSSGPTPPNPSPPPTTPPGPPLPPSQPPPDLTPSPPSSPDQSESPVAGDPATVTVASGGIITITWNPPIGGEPENYRVDIFNEKKELVRQAFVSSGIHKLVIRDLPAGKYYTVIYFWKNGTYRKASIPSSFNTTVIQFEENIKPASFLALSARRLFIIVPLSIIFGLGLWVGLRQLIYARKK